MKFINLLFWAGLLLVVVGCSVADDTVSQEENVPWAEASFVDPALTDITFTNLDDETHTLATDLRWYRDEIGKQVPDSLLAGESVMITVELHHPRYMFYSSGGQSSMRVVLPGRSRHLAFEGEVVLKQGAFVDEYNYLDEVLIPLNPAGRRPPVIKDLEQFLRKEKASDRAHLDSLSLPEGLPDYLTAFLDRTLEVKAYRAALQIRAYYKLFYRDTLAVAPAIIDSIAGVLRRPGYYQTPEYTELFDGLAMYREESANTVYETPAAINHAALTAGYLENYPAPARRYDAIAERLAYDISNPRLFSGKMENIDTLRKLLPEEYLTKLKAVEQKAIERSASKNGLADFLKAPYATPAGTEASVNGLATKPLRLLKFWFAGCYPCLVQQPYETELLAKHPEVDLIYVAHNTKKDIWGEYLLKHHPPAELQLYVPLKEKGTIQDAAGTTGAPTYVMVDDEDEIICRPCPKPDDPLLGEIIEKAMVGENKK